MPKKKKNAPKINLLAGLAPKGKSAAQAVDRPVSVHPPSAPTPTEFPPAARSAERGRPFAAAVSASKEQVFLEDDAGKRVEPSPTPKPVFVADKAVSPVNPELPTAPPEPPPVQPRVPGMLRTGKITRPEPPQPDKASEPQPVASPEPPPVQPRVPGMLRTGKVTRPEPPQPDKASEPQPAAPTSAAAAQIQDLETPPVEYWEHISTRLDDLLEETAPDEAVHEPEPEETTYNTATRMSGLRNLIFSMGLKNLNKEAKPGVEEAESAPQPGKGTERPANARAFAPAPAPVSSSRSSASDASPTLVTAPPEILPPEQAAEKTDKKSSWANKIKARRDRRDAFDDVEILPSWRGQYKKK